MRVWQRVARVHRRQLMVAIYAQTPLFRFVVQLVVQ